MNANCEHKNMRHVGEAVYCADCEPRQEFSVTETARLIRSALKAAFPDVKFSVRSKSYSGGASITVYYTDGPPSKAVDAIAQRFAGADFDGMQDLKTYHDSIFNGRPASFGADFVFVSRSFSGENGSPDLCGNLKPDAQSPQNRVEELLKARINYHSSNVHYLPRQEAWEVLAMWDARWETLERAVERFMYERTGSAYAQ